MLETAPLRSWKRILNNTTLTLGCNDIFGQDPPTAFNLTSANYAEAIYDSVGRFVYVSLKMRF